MLYLIVYLKHSENILNKSYKLNCFLNLELAKDNLDLLQKQSIDSRENQEILDLQEENNSLKQQLKQNQDSIDALKNNLRVVSDESELLKQSYDELCQRNDLLIDNNSYLTDQLNQLERPYSSSESQNTTKQMIQKQIHHTPVQEVS